MVFCVGLIGNIASGKSTVAKKFIELGIEVISADQIARELTVQGQPAYKQIIEHFGNAILANTGELDRAQLRQLIFNNSTERLWLEKLLHPLIREQIKNKVNHSQSPFCIIEIPLLPVKADYPYLNRILLVLAEREQQITRLIARDNSSREKAIAILTTQANETKHRAIADDILFNNGSLEQLEQQVSHFYEKYKKYAANTD